MIYFVITSLSLFTAVWSVDKHSNKTYLTFCVVTATCILTLFAGFRQIGLDFDSYLDHFKVVPSIFQYTWTDKSMEIGYEISVSLCKTIYNSFHFFLVTFSFVTIFLAFTLFKRYSPYVLLSFFMFFAYAFYLQVMGQMRQPFAIIVTLLGLIPLLQKKRVILAFLWITIVGFFFHKAMLLLAIPIFMANWDFNKKTIFCFSTIALAFYIASPMLSEIIIQLIPQNFYLSEALTAYLSYKSMAVSFSMGMIERAGMSFLFFYYAFKYNINHQEQILRLSINLYLIGTCMYFALITMSAEFASRGTIALVYPLFIALPFLLKHVNLKDKYIILTIICAWGVYLSLNILNDASEYIPYKSILF